MCRKGVEFAESASSLETSPMKLLLFDYAPNCKRVFIFDHTIRSITPGTKRPPLTRCHLDQSPTSSVGRVRYHPGEEANVLQQRRYSFINIRVPLSGPVVEYPLGIGSSTYPHHTGETSGVIYNEGYHWYYWSGVDAHARITLQCFDSEALSSGCKGKVLGGGALDSAFEDLRTPKDAPRKLDWSSSSKVFLSLAASEFYGNAAAKFLLSQSSMATFYFIVSILLLALHDFRMK
ncbi:hypothetical protein PMAA_079540 [Talaromyces marneffei ATCC 18224]|uniref:Uncharacterized protein n=1 Tax=Talaromyces marneffei (strain ATCC 18224 / CBS 334.59 / QM 7333) TaxID=441960 RepID=B6QEC5_TALMQ|nr:hypothetical protein PMAA_079540 [Talaromyces marneffei ATCC 18224]